MAVPRILRDSAAVLTATFYSGETAVDASAVTVQVLRGDGTELVAAGTAATKIVGPPVRYELALTAAQTAAVDRLTAVWTSTTAGKRATLTEIVGGFYVELAEIRALPNLADTAKFTAVELADARTWFEDLAERHRGAAYVGRYQRDVVDGDGTDQILLTRLHPVKILSATVDGAAQTVTGWKTYPHGAAVRDAGTFAKGHRNVAVAYEHGHTAPDEDLRQAALVAIRARLLSDQAGLPSRELSIRNEFGNVSIAHPGPGRPTGIPEVDEVLNAVRETVPGVA